MAKNQIISFNGKETRKLKKKRVTKKKTMPKTHKCKKSRTLIERVPYGPRTANRFKWERLRQRQINYEKVIFPDLEILQYIGAGGFGSVRLVRYKNQYMALKTVRKRFVEVTGCVAEVVKERKILYEMRDCPFIVHLHRTFRTDQNVHFLMELCIGGDTFAYARSFEGGRHMPEENAKFIAGCVVEALRFLRDRNYIFRDLKERNILINGHGWCKLADFGFCTQLKPGEKLLDVCGTVTYFSPELVKGRPYDNGVDLWALGVTLYGLLTNNCLFPYGDNLFQHILNGVNAVQFPDYLSTSARGIIRALCRKEPAKRLGYKSLDELEQNPWLRSLDWRGLREQAIESPIQRNFTNAGDTRYFQPNKKQLVQYMFLQSKSDNAPAKNADGWDAEF